MSKIVVIGGGASGLVASICASFGDNEVILLEKERDCGKKILVSGNGRCNYFNNDFKIDYYYSDDKDILGEIINFSNKQKVLKLLNSIGIVPRIKDNLYYPYSNQAISVKNALCLEAVSRGVVIRNNSSVFDIVKSDDKFVISFLDEKIVCDKVIFSCGSKAYIKSDLDLNYNLLEKLGHSFNTVLPGLTGLCSKQKYFKDISGVRCDGEVSLYVNDKLVKKETGNIQFTSYGVSGICIFNLSLIASKCLSNGDKVSLKINLMPEFDFSNDEEVVNWLSLRSDLLHNKSISSILDSILNYKLSNLLLKICKIDGSLSFDDISSSLMKELAHNIISFSVDVCGTNDFNLSQVALGGVSLKEIDINTMESKIVKDLYITGEILDVTGICGGYNIGFAFLSGMIAGYAAGGFDD